MKRPRILFVPRWYPDRTDPMPGLFIQQLAESFVPVADITVLCVCPDPACAVSYELEYTKEQGVDVVRVYYRPGSTMASRWWKYVSAYRRGFHMVRGWAPDLIHAHILTRTGVIAWWLSRRFRVPFMVSEHWSRYFSLNGTYKGMLRKWVTRMVVQRAAALTAVSGELKNAMILHGLDNPRFRVIPNGVETGLFRPAGSREQNREVHFVHVSCFDDRSKNISGLLDAVRKLSDRRSGFICHLVGEGPDLQAMKEIVGKPGFPMDLVIFEGRLEGNGLVNMVNHADFLVLSSRYETFGTVVIESLACGTPVLATRVGIAPSVITPVNGKLIPPADNGALEEGIAWMLDHCRDFDRNEVRNTVSEDFSFRSITDKLLDLYREIISEKHV